MADLSTTYMGLSLKNPVVPSASPLSRDLDNIRRMEDAGAGAITLYSLFEEQIDREAILLDDILEDQKYRYAEMTEFFPEPEVFRRDEMEYLELIRQAKKAVDIPVIASLNGYSEGGWTSYARAFEQAGADAIELNVYYIPTSHRLTGAQVEALYFNILHDVRDRVSIPIAMKLSRFSALSRTSPQFWHAAEPMAWSVQPVLPARDRCRVTGLRATPGAQHIRGDSPPVALDRHPIRQGQRVTGTHDGCSYLSRCDQGHYGWGRHRQRVLSAIAEGRG